MGDGVPNSLRGTARPSNIHVSVVVVVVVLNVLPDKVIFRMRLTLDVVGAVVVVVNVKPPILRIRLALVVVVVVVLLGNFTFGMCSSFLGLGVDGTVCIVYG
eukprot:gnl/MRDRNA2_/MRDRNA2_69723_c0_seq2.p2 gnl/MRDRNA2_/MRDRNA2_69723_c0~~gnl/MRDRNA2_/MRDRNA2_69723_c0_seq2.p2  ORF type:complete len:102 (-),score=2.23 gnl/MRDRNA2_/MRDRNA2_69723_c0_seq2:201-506(-)